MQDEREELYRKAIHLWGVHAQLAMLQEECAEAIVAVNKCFRNKEGSAADLAEEIADVEIMCEQARIVVGSDRIDAAKERKISRLKERITSATKAESEGS